PSNVPFLSKRQLEGDLEFIDAVNVASSYVDGLYRRFLNRAPDAGGLTTWVSMLVGGTPRTAVVAGIWNSHEHRLQQVNELYEQYLRRDASPAEQALWANAYLTGATTEQISAAILAS